MSALLIALLGCRSTEEPAPEAADTAASRVSYTATVRWTDYGIPHINADDYGSLAYGMGYAFARDRICMLADQIVRVRSERSRYFGPGEDDANITSDFGWLALGVRAQAEAGFDALSEEIQAGITGYAAGYNRWLDEVGVDGLPADCQGAEWVVPIDRIDLLSWYLALGLNGSGAALLELVATAQPPGTASRPPPPESMSVFDGVIDPPLGSNGWAIGAERSATGGGMLLSNTHFPYVGARKWHESHLTIPGELDVYGASLTGVPLINIGFNQDIAWTHTVSNTPRFTMYLLPLDPEDPTRYAYGDDYLDMTSQTFTIEVLEGGELVSQQRTLYRSHYGPVLNAPLVGWSSSAAIVYRDANDNNLQMSQIWLEMNRATSMDEFQAAHAEVHAIPWVHTLAADADGQAWYTDSASTPNLSDAAYAAYDALLEESSFVALFQSYGLMLLDGSDPVFAWQEEDGAREPGLVPFADNPQLLRDDYVFNANDNHWLTNPAAPLTGYAPLYGEERTPRTPRTRMNGRYLGEVGPAAAAGEDGLFTLDELATAALSGRVLTAELLREDVAAQCAAVKEVDGVDITEACAVLAAWDGTARLESVGEVLWRETLGTDHYEWDDAKDAGALFAVGFDPDDPIATPNTLVEGETILAALADAVQTLDSANIPVDAALGDVQFARIGEEDIPIMGAPYFTGPIAVASYSSGASEALIPVPEQSTVINSTTDLTDEGYLINNGNSWVMAMAYTEDGPQAQAILTYSQSADPSSPHFTDQSWLYAEQTLRPIYFTEEDIAAHTEEEVLLTTQ